jgi:hypothetical protein
MTVSIKYNDSKLQQFHEYYKNYVLNAHEEILYNISSILTDGCSEAFHLLRDEANFLVKLYIDYINIFYEEKTRYFLDLSNDISGYLIIKGIFTEEINEIKNMLPTFDESDIDFVNKLIELLTYLNEKE